MPTDTFYPDPHIETTSGDASMNVDQLSANWSDHYGATSASNLGDEGADGYIQTFKRPTGYLVNRNFFNIDTSSIPDSNTIESAVFSVFRTNYQVNASVTVALVNSTASQPLVAGDFDLCGTTLQSDATPALNDGTDNAYYDWTLNATGKGNISKTGLTKLAIRTYNFDIGNTAPTDTTQRTWTIKMAETAGTSSDPKLVVVSSATTVKPISNMLLMGV